MSRRILQRRHGNSERQIKSLSFAHIWQFLCIKSRTEEVGKQFSRWRFFFLFVAFVKLSLICFSELVKWLLEFNQKVLITSPLCMWYLLLTSVVWLWSFTFIDRLRLIWNFFIRRQRLNEFCWWKTHDFELGDSKIVFAIFTIASTIYINYFLMAFSTCDLCHFPLCCHRLPGASESENCDIRLRTTGKRMK